MTTTRPIWRTAQYIDVRTYFVSDQAAGVLVASAGKLLPAPLQSSEVRFDSAGVRCVATLQRANASLVEHPFIKTARGWVWTLFDPRAENTGAPIRFGRSFKFHTIPSPVAAAKLSRRRLNAAAPDLLAALERAERHLAERYYAMRGGLVKSEAITNADQRLGDDLSAVRFAIARAKSQA